MLAVVAALYDRNWVEAEAPLWCLALAGEPVPAMVRFHYSPFFLEPLGRYAESLANLEPALAAEPLYLLGRVVRATGLYTVGRVDEGLAEFEELGVWGQCAVRARRRHSRARVTALAGRLDEARTFADGVHVGAAPPERGRHAGRHPRTHGE